LRKSHFNKTASAVFYFPAFVAVQHLQIGFAYVALQHKKPRFAPSSKITIVKFCAAQYSTYSSANFTRSIGYNRYFAIISYNRYQVQISRPQCADFSAKLVQNQVTFFRGLFNRRKKALRRLSVKGLIYHF